ncbi:MAG TPA: hypothetical protein VMB25_03940 [Bryobacteraceae bacterium]|nr:hypothetical protein [Bryobacteraceae bacterium]
MSRVQQCRLTSANGCLASHLVEESEARLNISVVFTSVKPTLSALREAGRLASSLGGYITLLVPQVVPYPLELERKKEWDTFNERRFRTVAGASSVSTTVRVYLCRDPEEAVLAALTPRSLVVIGGRKRWWPTLEKRLAGKLRRAGHEVILAEGS